MNTVCKMNGCSGCMACVDVCSQKAIAVVDNIEYMNAVIDEERCIKCGACSRVCQQNNPAELRKPLSWLQGWGAENIRATSSSGGFGQEIMRTMIRSGGAVAACKLQEGKFRFELFEDESRIPEFIGSKYVKSNPVGIYQTVRDRLKTGKKVLFIGLPCQVSAMRNYVKNDKNLYTVDLICHGSPSAKLLHKAISEYGYDLTEVNAIYFRAANKFAIETQPTPIVPKGVQDRYTMAFLKGLCYTENCYSCHYAQTERVGDLTIGDSWGTELSSELSKGVSLALCQTEKGKEMLDMMNFTFYDVDLENAVQRNHQLRHPSELPQERKKFFKDLRKGKSFKQAVFSAYPKTCIRQNIKELLIKTKLYSGGAMSSPVYTISIIPYSNNISKNN